MNPISKAMDEIIWEIPPQILQQVFVTQEMATCGELISMETRIREAVINPRVLVDIDLYGMTEDFIPLDLPVQTRYIDPYTVVYQIPDEMTQNRPITQAYSIHFGIVGYQAGGQALNYTESSMGSEARKVLDAAKRTPPAQTSYINLIAHNTIMTRFVYLPYAAAYLRCRLGNDEALSTIRYTAIPDFAALCVLAVKAYIYNTMRIPMDQAFLSGGQQLGSFSGAVLEWADCAQLYKDALKRWKKISIFNDPEARRRHLRSITGAQ
jgi:hypothetical protein